MFECCSLALAPAMFYMYLLFPPRGKVVVSRSYWDGKIPDWPGPITGDLKFTPWGPIHPSPPPPII